MNSYDQFLMSETNFMLQYNYDGLDLGMGFLRASACVLGYA